MTHLHCLRRCDHPVFVEHEGQTVCERCLNHGTRRVTPAYDCGGDPLTCKLDFMGAWDWPDEMRRAQAQLDPRRETLRLSCYGIVVEITDGNNFDGYTGNIKSQLHEGELPSSAREGRARELHAAIDAIELLILAHACVGVDIEDPDYVEGIETAVDAVFNHLG